MKKLLLLFLLSGCTLTREQIEGELWTHDQLPARLCQGEVEDFGIFRRLPCRPEIAECSNGEKFYQEFIPYCAPRIKEFLAADRKNVADWLSKLRRPRK